MLTHTHTRRDCGRMAVIHGWTERNWAHVTAAVRRQLRRLTGGANYDPDTCADALAMVWSALRALPDAAALEATAQHDSAGTTLPRCAWRIIDRCAADAHRGRSLTRSPCYVDACAPQDWRGRADIDAAAAAERAAAAHRAAARELLGIDPIGMRIVTTSGRTGANVPVDVWIMPDR